MTVSIEKAILADICLGIPLGKLVFSIPAHEGLEEIAGSAPDTFLFRGEQLALMKSLYERGDSRIAEAVSELARSADAAMQDGPFCVTQKPRSRFGDDPHDYQSLAKYWWPNPDTQDGLPYVNRDGEINPECYADDFDYVRLVRFSETVVLLALAAYLTGRAEYGKRAALLLETWFVDPATRQNPNFRFGQNFPGQHDVRKHALRWYSIIEARFLIYVTEAVRLLSGSDALKPASHEQIRSWFSELLTWLLESEHGRKAKLAKNNIGFWYDLQCLIYAQFCGRSDLAERIIREDVVPRLNAQMATDGSLPHELGRAYPKDYVAFTLAAMALISRAGERAGLELWDERQSDGRNFQVAHDWLLKSGDARKRLSASSVETKTASADDEFHDLGFLLETGVKLRAFQRIAETEARAASILRDENEALKQQLEAFEADLRAQLAATAAARGERDAQVALQRRLEEAKAGLRAQLVETAEAHGERGAEVAALERRLEEATAQIEMLDASLKSVKADLKFKRVDLARLREEREARQLKLEGVREQRRELASIARKLMKDRDALLGHSGELETRYRAVLASTSWRATGPFRIVARKAKSLLTGKRSRRNYIPRRPTLSAIGPDDVATSPRPKSAPRRPDGARPAAVADRIKAMARESLPPAAREAVKAMLNAAPGKQAVMKTLSGMAAKVKPPAADPLETLLAAKPRDEEALKREYRDKGLDREPETFVLYRIIGNDLYPRHKKGQSRENVRFILENEPELVDCEKRWVVNRIIDLEEERQIIAMLEAHGQPFLHIPFVAEEYRKIGWDFDALPAPDFLASEEFQRLGPKQRDRVRIALYRLKNNYVMHNNGARNAALRDGRGRAKWVLPWDGNGFVTAKAWQEIRHAVMLRPHLKYFAVPMERVTDNAVLLRHDFTPHPVEEPQLLFRRDAGEEFNNDFPYGRRPKVELFWRLGIPGPWDNWDDDPWDQKRRLLSPEAYQFGVAGWVARMFSGIKHFELKDVQGSRSRNHARQEAIVAALNFVDDLVGIAPSSERDAIY